MKTPTKNSPARKRVKARLMYAAYNHPDSNPLLLNAHKYEAEQRIGNSIDEAQPVFVLPADAQSIEEMRDAIAEEVYHFMAGEYAMPFSKLKEPIKVYYRFRANAALKALKALNLIAPPKQKGGKGLTRKVPYGWRVLGPEERIINGDKFWNSIETIGPLGWVRALSIAHQVKENHLGCTYIRRTTKADKRP